MDRIAALARRERSLVGEGDSDERRLQVAIVESRSCGQRMQPADGEGAVVIEMEMQRGSFGDRIDVVLVRHRPAQFP